MLLILDIESNYHATGITAMHSDSDMADDLGGLSPASGVGSTQQEDQPNGPRTNRSPAVPDPEDKADLFLSNTDERQTDHRGSEDQEQ